MPSVLFQLVQEPWLEPLKAEPHRVGEPLAEQDRHVSTVAAAGAATRVRHHVPITFQAGVAPGDDPGRVKVRDVNLVVDVDGVVTRHRSTR